MRAIDLLPDDTNVARVNGELVRKGTIGAFLVNARTLMAGTAATQEQTSARAHIIEALPALEALGVFDVFEVRDPALRELITAHALSRG